MTFRRFRKHLADLEEKWKGTTAVPEPISGKGPIVKLDSNENPFLPDIDLSGLVRDLEVNRYPDASMLELRERLAGICNVDPEQVVVGNGCDELIDLAIRLLVEPGETLLNCPPTFIMYRRFAEVFGARVLDVPRKRDYRIATAKIREITEQVPAARVLFLCSPNNPTGTTVSEEELEELTDLPLWIIADETYYNFSRKTLLRGMEISDRFAVVRSFSKGHGLAGLRIGFGVFPVDLARLMRRVRPPYSVNLVAQKAALETLKRLDQWEEKIRKILDQRERVYQRLLEVAKAHPGEIQPFPSAANFIFCETSSQFEERLKETLARERVSVRFLSSPYSEAAFRVSIGSIEENDRFLSALEKAVS